jgi:D-beta-D-heptose 7-phosphate kinase/D-beta-D-heptose 1-phosphate adenosyltransferase
MTLATPDGSVTVPAEGKDVYDVTGAGDTVAAVVALSLAAGGGLEVAARIANTAAGVAVGKVGTATVLVGEILSAWRTRDDAKHLPVEELAASLAAHRRAGRSIVFTNGCFDILHTGHLKVLRRASMLGDVVVVAVNSDSSVRRLKGRERPFVALDQRMQLVAALDFVDYVVPFEEDTPLRIIERLQPDVLLKGGDYSPDGVIGKEIVEARGGRVEIVPFLEGVSTSQLADRIRRSGRANKEVSVREEGA